MNQVSVLFVINLYLIVINALQVCNAKDALKDIICLQIINAFPLVNLIN